MCGFEVEPIRSMLLLCCCMLLLLPRPVEEARLSHFSSSLLAYLRRRTNGREQKVPPEGWTVFVH